MPYDLLPHTADLRVRLRGRDIAQLYATAVDVVRDTLVGDSDVRPAEGRSVELPPGHTGGERLYRFVRELLYLFDVEAFLPARLEDEPTLRVRGETFDPARHSLEHQVKALTRHNYRFERTAGGFEAEMVFDL